MDGYIPRFYVAEEGIFVGDERGLERFLGVGVVLECDGRRHFDSWWYGS